ncbi:hypothetical protein LEN26_019901 [Aphanomyces euteiches]|nr:hypothetical protein LEN26_019901 [Aphanomyces euteiches]KAH9106858.1 hypothetical protein AeMF1_017637 [Aphanomyces euteiches]KAH9187600.1 hypothetical protein AeNC1_010422 [Aphanomyces euteiches]
MIDRAKNQTSTTTGHAFKSVPGIFSYQSTSKMTSLFEHYTRIAASWPTFRSLEVFNDPNVKTLYFIRHAEGDHNAAEREYGTEVWDESISKLDKYLDAALNRGGMADAQKRSIFMKTELDAGMPIDRILVSPLTRTIQTADIYFNLSSTELFPVDAIESARETLGVHTCDKRRPTSLLARDFMFVNWSRISSEQDVLWRADHRETSAEIEARCRVFLEEVFATVSETFVAVVSHGGFIRACMNVLEIPSYKPRNCEVVPVVVQRSPLRDDEDALDLGAFLVALLVVFVSYRFASRKGSAS